MTGLDLASSPSDGPLLRISLPSGAPWVVRDGAGAQRLRMSFGRFADGRRAIVGASETTRRPNVSREVPTSDVRHDH
jgi:hypothetical protein